MTDTDPNDFIRRRLRGEPEPGASLDQLRRHAAAATGLPVHLAGRLQGATLDELVTDAETIAADLAPPVPKPPYFSWDGGPKEPPPEPESPMSSIIRAARDHRRGLPFDTRYWDEQLRHDLHDGQHGNGPNPAD